MILVYVLALLVVLLVNRMKYYMVRKNTGDDATSVEKGIGEEVRGTSNTTEVEASTRTGTKFNSLEYPSRSVHIHEVFTSQTGLKSYQSTDLSYFNTIDSSHRTLSDVCLLPPTPVSVA